MGLPLEAERVAQLYESGVGAVALTGLANALADGARDAAAATAAADDDNDDGRLCALAAQHYKIAAEASAPAVAALRRAYAWTSIVTITRPCETSNHCPRGQ